MQMSINHVYASGSPVLEYPSCMKLGFRLGIFVLILLELPLLNRDIGQIHGHALASLSPCTFLLSLYGFETLR